MIFVSFISRIIIISYCFLVDIVAFISGNDRGGIPRSGEISLAHHGVCQVELPEFERKLLEVLSEPLESGHITISRSARQADFPAQFQLLTTMNPCPCGYLGHYNNKCRCTPDNIARYKAKISGPLLDRVDLHIEVSAIKEDKLTGKTMAENSVAIHDRVERARKVPLNRQSKANAGLGSLEIDQHCQPDDAGLTLLKNAITRLNLSARTYHRILKVARTIADLAGDRHSNYTHCRGRAISAW